MSVNHTIFQSKPTRKIRVLVHSASQNFLQILHLACFSIVVPSKNMRFAPYASGPVHRFAEESEMQDEAKTKEQLIIELQALRQRVAESEKDKAEQAAIEHQHYLQTIIHSIVRQR